MQFCITRQQLHRKCCFGSKRIFEREKNVGKKFELIAKTFAGLEEVLADELKSIGGEDISTGKRVVNFMGDLEAMYKANLYSRTALRILKPIFSFTARNEDEFYLKMKRFKWYSIFGLNDTFAIDCVIPYSDYFNHSHYMALKTKDAIVDQFSDKFQKRPSIDVDHPSMRIHVFIQNNNVSISLDSSGSSLNRRGYRGRTDIAPLNEVLAAGMLLLSGWKGNKTFIDPMCGSGTILIEAAYIATNTPAGLNRPEFGFQLWKDFDRELWEGLLDEAHKAIKKPEVEVIGSDSSRRALKIAEENIKNAGFKKRIKLASRPIQTFEPPEVDGFVVTNPPYGERMPDEKIFELYADIGERFKHKFTGYTAWLLSSNINALKKIGLRPSKKITLYNGALECKYLKYELYSGSRKQKKKD